MKNKLQSLKEEVSSDLGTGISKDHPYMGDLPSNVVGKLFNSGNVGGEMIKRIIEEENKLK